MGKDWEQDQSAGQRSMEYDIEADGTVENSSLSQQQRETLLSKMHWALQVGEGDSERTFELQISRKGKISAVVGQWTQKEWDLQPKTFAKDEVVGHTTLTDQELEDRG